MHSPIDVGRTRVAELARVAEVALHATGDEPDLAQSTRDHGIPVSNLAHRGKGAAWGDDAAAAQSRRDRTSSSAARFALVACWRLLRRKLRLAAARGRLVMGRVVVCTSILTVWFCRVVCAVSELVVVGLAACKSERLVVTQDCQEHLTAIQDHLHRHQHPQALYS